MDWPITGSMIDHHLKVNRAGACFDDQRLWPTNGHHQGLDRLLTVLWWSLWEIASGLSRCAGSTKEPIERIASGEMVAGFSR